MSKYTTVKYEYLHQTEDAILILGANGKTWIPKSVIENGHELNFEDDYELDCEMEVEKWFAIEEELV